MINLLVGHHGGMEDDGSIIVLVQGVGYGVIFHDRDRDRVNVKGLGGELRVHVREVTTEQQGTRLFGFLDVDERRAFDRIVKVDGFGAAMATRVLSSHPLGQLAKLIAAGDPKPFLKIHGVGKVGAKKLLTVRL